MVYCCETPSLPVESLYTYIHIYIVCAFVKQDANATETKKRLQARCKQKILASRNEYKHFFVFTSQILAYLPLLYGFSSTQFPTDHPAITLRSPVIGCLNTEPGKVK